MRIVRVLAAVTVVCIGAYVGALPGSMMDRAPDVDEDVFACAIKIAEADENTAAAYAHIVRKLVEAGERERAGRLLRAAVAFSGDRNAVSVRRDPWQDTYRVVSIADAYLDLGAIGSAVEIVQQEKESSHLKAGVLSRVAL